MILDILWTMVAGLAASAAMSAVMYALTITNIANGDMIRALGSMLTRRKEGAILPGLLTHLIAGAMFAFPYAVILSLTPETAMGAKTGVGALMGFFHGFVFSFMLVAMVAESHPLEEFREVGKSVAVAHIVGHVAYGAVMGVMVALLQINYPLRLIAGGS